LDIALGSVQDILDNDLGLRLVATKLVPNNLNFMQKRDHVDVVIREHFAKNETNTILANLVDSKCDHMCHPLWCNI
jgi:hypothetical protein